MKILLNIMKIPAEIWNRGRFEIYLQQPWQ